ncbi:MAG: hypothetical protein ACJ8MR_09615 [Povalibacter sp.]
MPRGTDDHENNIDLPASPYTLVGAGVANGIVYTYQGRMTVNEAAALAVRKIRSFDWMNFVSERQLIEEKLFREYELMLDVVSLMAEIDLAQARQLWERHAPLGVGVPRMLAHEHQSQEQLYLNNLAAQRGLSEDELALHILEQGAFMSEWAEARRQLIVAHDTIPHLPLLR